MSSLTSNPQTLAPEQRLSKMPRIESQVVESFDISTIQLYQGYIPKYGNILLINKMQLDVFILKSIRIS
jgi:hypothetical protein